MSLKELKENKIIAGQLMKQIGTGKTVHAFLFIGPSEERLALGKEFAKALLCTRNGETFGADYPAAQSNFHSVLQSNSSGGSADGSGPNSPGNFAEGSKLSFPSNSADGFSPNFQANSVESFSPNSLGDSCGQCLSCRKFDHGNHEDFILVERPENKQSIVVAQIEELQEKLNYKAFGSRRVVIISEAQLMNLQAQNKLLKTLEEPVEGTVLILLADSRENLLPTILSRCSCYYLQESAAVYSPEAKELAKQFAMLVDKRAPFYKKKDCIKPILSSKDDARTKGIEFLTALEEELRQLLLNGSSCDLACLTNAFTELEDALKNLKLSYNTAYVLKGMCLRI